MSDAVLVLNIAFGVWMALTVAIQFAPVSRWLARYDRLGMVPRWTFFAPNPGTNDHHVVYRECLSPDADLTTPDRIEAASNMLSPWREMADLCPGHHILFLWNPQRRINKTISDLINAFTITRRENPEFQKYIHYTVEYLILLHLALRDAPPNAQRQFAVVRTNGFGDQRVAVPVFVSQFHSTA